MVIQSPSFLQRGTTLIEVLVTIVILVFGLLGLAGLQARLQVSEMESYQRVQALILLEDMANRVMTNRAVTAAYVANSPVGGAACSASPPTTTQEADTIEWCNELRGAAEIAAGGSKVGAMIGARGCIQNTALAGEYLVTVAWQGLIPMVAPPASVDCGKDEYDGGDCTGDRCRRTVTTIVRIGTLS